MSEEDRSEAGEPDDFRSDVFSRGAKALSQLAKLPAAVAFEDATRSRRGDPDGCAFRSPDLWITERSGRPRLPCFEAAISASAARTSSGVKRPDRDGRERRREIHQVTPAPNTPNAPSQARLSGGRLESGASAPFASRDGAGARSDPISVPSG